MDSGRCHALGLASRGAKVVVNDIGKDGLAPDSALKVVDEIRAAGGVAMADGADVVSFEQITAMVSHAEEEWAESTSSSTMPASYATRPSPKWKWTTLNVSFACI